MIKLGSLLYELKSSVVVNTPFRLQTISFLDSFVFKDLYRESEQNVEEFAVKI